MGLLLGVALHEGTSFPVGKVDFLNLYPLNFREFLMAVGQEQLKELLDTQDYSLIILCAQGKLDPRILLEGSRIFEEFKGAHLQAKSLRKYCQKYSPEIAVRTYMSNYREQEWMVNVPLYALAPYFSNL